MLKKNKKGDKVVVNRFKDYFKKVKKALVKVEMGMLPASLAFNFMLAIIPILTLTVLIASSFNISIDNVTKLIGNVLPQESSKVVIDIISGKGFDNTVGIFNIVAFIIATNGTYAIVKAANTLYGIKKSDAFKDRIKSIIILLAIIVLLIFMILVPMFGDKILEVLRNNTVLENIIDEVIILFKIIKWPITFLILLFNIKLIYTIAPSKNVKSENTTYGALTTTILWMIFTVVFGYYLKYFARYDILYGNLSSIIILMIFLYMISYVFVLGMVINTTKYEKEEDL